MKYLLLFIGIFVSLASFSKEKLPIDCAHLSSATEAHFVLFNKKELIQLGECLAINNLKSSSKLDLVKSCNEVDEDKRNFLGILSLSKLEAILIGECVGAINYVYEHFHNEYVSSIYGSPGKVYRCTRGESAVDVIRQNSLAEIDRSELRSLLCDEVYR